MLEKERAAQQDASISEQRPAVEIESHSVVSSTHSHTSGTDESPLGAEKNDIPEELHSVDPDAIDVQNTAELGLSRSRSRASSTRSRPLLTVPRAERRGLFSHLTIIPEAVNPYDYKRSTKWGITATIAIATAAAPLGSSIFYREYLHGPRIITV